MSDAAKRGYYVSERDDNPNELVAGIYQTDLSEVVIPSEVDGKTVTMLILNSPEAPELRRLVIPATVKDIYFFPYIMGSFKEFKAEVDPQNLWLTSDDKAIFSKDKSVLVLFTARQDKVYQLPEEVRTLGKYSFAGCDDLLEEIVFPEGLEKIDEHAFYSCENIKKLVLPDSLKVIEENAFDTAGASSIDIRLSKNLEVIKDNAFSVVNCIEEMHIHSKLKEIGEDAFPRKINVFKADEDNEFFTVKDGILYSKDMKTVIHASMEVNGKVTIPGGVEVIQPEAFSRNDKITEVLLPPTLHTIKSSAFEYCYSLEKINLENVKRIGTSAFHYAKMTEAETCAPYINCFGGCSELEDLTLKNTRTIGDFAFSGCSSLKKLNLPESLETIEMYAFSNMPVRSFRIPKNVTKIGDYAFDADYVEIYDTEPSPVSRGRAFSNHDHLLIVRSAETDEIKFAVPVYLRAHVDKYRQLSDEIIMILFDKTAEKYDYALYDLVFQKGYNSENFAGKFMAAHYRLKYPIDLSDEARKMYCSYIDEYAGEIVVKLIKKEDFDIDEIKEFPYLDRIDSEEFGRLIAVSEGFERTELAEWLKSYKEKSRTIDSADSLEASEVNAENKEDKLGSAENEERLYNLLWKNVFDQYICDAEKGNCDAQYEVAIAYEEGRGVPKDEKLAAEWMTKSAEQGYAYAQFILGVYYEEGTGVEKNPEEAFRLYKKAAEQNNKVAQYKVGMCYYSGKGTGLPEDKQEAVIWIARSADQGYAPAQSQLAWHYLVGNGVEENYEKAAEYHIKAVEQGNTKAMCNFALQYRYGLWVEKNIYKAIELYEKAVELGSDFAKKMLDELYDEVENDDELDENEKKEILAKRK